MMCRVSVLGRGHEKGRESIPCRGLEEAKYVNPKRNTGGFRGGISQLFSLGRT